ncbi:hypothetical protein N0V93_003436 [Gnomoniopsis smithogilvyi]|uniref:Extracellular matrix protein n=1 Tax=Gnomoniopsis smithogilvyi TaxID=1191159 RepID=A0A9W8YWN9_9PEZI|nr:hypothetical protein N0V93_003436 [Gnomoniopsis smithogilvyi]
MQFAARLLAFSAAISQALALVALTNTNWAVTEDTPFEITWTDANGPVTLLLKDGPSSNLATVATIASGLTGTSFSWTPTGIPSGTYAVEITDSEDTNYGSQFTYAGTGSATTTSAATSATTASSTATDSTSTTDSSSTTDSTSTTSSASTLTTSTVASTSNGTSTASSTGSTSTKSSSKTATSSSSTSTSTPLDTNASQKMGSPLALVLLTFAAVLLCH